MKTLSILLLSILMTSVVFSQGNQNYSKNEIIVKLKASVNTDPNNRTMSQRFGIRTLDSINSKTELEYFKLIGNQKENNTYVLSFKEEQDVAELIQKYEALSLFEFVEPNFIGRGGGVRGKSKPTDDPYFSRQYGLYNDGSFELSHSIDDADIDMELAWEIEQGSSSITIAVLDAGLRMDHPEFSGRIWKNTSDNIDGTDTDNNGFIDDMNGWDFANNDNDPTDDHGHGTNVTGIIAANHNFVGYAGVDKNAKIMVCKILDANNSGLYSWWTDAIYYAVDNGADVINMSVGGSGYSASMKDALDYAYQNGVTVVACMMNENNDVTYYPAGYNTTIAVGSTNANDERSSPFFWSASSGSNYGNHIDVVAPGNYIFGLSHLSDTNYDSYWGGTSQATPLVTGLVSLLKAQDPERTPRTIREIIRNSAEDQVGNPFEDKAGFDIYYGFGRINANQALQEPVISANSPDLKEENAIVYPNPATNHIFIETKNEYQEVRIVNSLGKELYKNQVAANSGTLKIDFSKFPAGLYLLTLKNEDQHDLRTHRIIKK